MSSATSQFESESSETKFTIEPHVAAEIAELSSCTGKRLVAALGSTDRRVYEETLVYFLRREHEAGDAVACSAIASQLTKRVSPKLAKLTRLWRLSYPADLAEDVIDEILTELYEQLFSGASTVAFWEIRFWVCFNRLAINVLRRRRFELDQIAADQGDESDDEYLAVESLPAKAEFDHPETAALLSDALAKLSQPVRTAFLLKHWSGHVEESTSPDEPSIAKLMGVSGRTVRNYLARAAKELETWRSEGKAVA